MLQDNTGHRDRLKKRFLTSGFSGFLDYEIIELILTLGIPRKDCKPLAKLLINKYKTISNVIFADENELKQFNGIGEKSILGVKVVKEAYLYISKENIKEENMRISDSMELIDFLKRKIGFEKKEQFVVICVDTKGNMIHEPISIGTIDSSIVHAREVFRVAIETNSKYIYIAHNHPSGNTTPSDEDILITRKLVEAGKVIDIEVLDHLIVSSNNYKSMKQLNYL
jgi:DNA repair protein RadC